METDPDEPTPFRERLAAIPKADDEPIDLSWENAASPSPKPAAPVARPGNSVYRGEPSEVEDRFFEDDRGFEDEPGAWPAAASDLSPAHPDTIVPERRRRRRRRIWPLVLFALLALVVLAIVVPLFIANRTFNNIDRIEVSDVLVEPLPAGTNMLLVGTDSREGIDADNPNARAILGDDVVGLRSDTIMVLRIGEDGSSFLSLPRDLWLPIDGGDSGRINGAIGRGGPEALISTVQTELGIPISHYMQVDFAGFLDVVDAVGGVEITIPHPASDRASGLSLPIAGTVTLDRDQALAYVRSRSYTETIDGQVVVDGTGDLGRVERQQAFMRGLMNKVMAERNPVTLNAMAEAMAGSLLLDDSTSLTDALQLLNQMRSLTPTSVTLPTTPERVGNAAVLTLNENSAEVLAQFSQ